MIIETSLLDQIVTFADAHGTTLPVFSDSATRLRLAATGDRYDIEDVERAIGSDPALTVEVLRVANSAFYGGLAQVTTTRQAFVRLGAEQVVRLAILASERSRYTARDSQLAGVMRELWVHASSCALASEWLARRLGYTALIEEVFIGGLLHDIGKVFVLRVLDEMVAVQPAETRVSIELAREVMRASHAEQGHRLATLWNLPQIYQVIVRDHHQEPLDSANVGLCVVRLANLACHKCGLGSAGDSAIDLASTPEAHVLRLGEVALAELEIVLEDIATNSAAT